VKLRRVAHWVEIIANVGVIATLLILILQVRDNTQVLRSQAIVQRAAPLLQPFIEQAPIPDILAQIKAVDGSEPMVQAYMDRYGLTYADGNSWARHVSQVWVSMEAEYALFGGSDFLDGRIRGLLSSQDQRIWYENGGAQRALSDVFLEYVEEVSASQ